MKVFSDEFEKVMKDMFALGGIEYISLDFYPNGEYWISPRFKGGNNDK